MRSSLNAVSFAAAAWKKVVKEGDVCIDATAGRGNDTLMLCRLVGQTGTVHAFDIQPEAVNSTKALLESCGMQDRAQVHNVSHCRMDELCKEKSVAAICFNFGWLPGADHSICTKKDTSLEAIRKGLALLAPGGVMTLIIYSGKDTGYEERDAILAYLPQIDSKEYTVLPVPFVNRPNDPPIPVLIFREPVISEP